MEAQWCSRRGVERPHRNSEQLARQVAWLRAGEGTLIGDGAGSGVTVLDVFFFEQL
jgi:hypothetical protein